MPPSSISALPCTLCGRPTPVGLIERHHLVPRSLRGRETVPVCVDCGDQVHKLFTNKQLASELNTVERLLAEPAMQRWVAWVRTKRAFGFRQRRRRR